MSNIRFLVLPQGQHYQPRASWARKRWAHWDMAALVFCAAVVLAVVVVTCLYNVPVKP